MTDDMQVERDEVLSRLRRVEGQIRGIQRMIAEDRDCEAIVTQIMAARAALDKASLLVASQHIEQCLLNQEQQADPKRLKRIVEFLIRLSAGPAEAE